MKNKKKSNHPWFKEKRYLHFDFPIGEKRAEQYVLHFREKPDHSFYPFITYTLKLRRVTRVPILERSDNKRSLKFKPKKRPLAYCAHRDRAIYSYYAYLLNDDYEIYLKRCVFSNSVFAFRKLGKSNIHFAKEVFDEVKKYESCLVIAMDIKSFFDHLDHNLIKKQWKTILGVDELPKDHYKVFKAITKYSEVERSSIYDALNISRYHTPKNLYRFCDSKTYRKKIRPLINNNKDSKNCTKGIPQGSPISALISNIYMIDFDKKAYELANSVNGNYYRYCDDILFILPNIDFSKENFYKNKISHYIEDINLVLNKDKTEVFHFQNGYITNQNKPLQYLGFCFDGKNILLRAAGIQKCYSRIRGSTKLASRTRNKRLKSKSPLARNTLHRKKLYEQYTHVGKRNYISYALNSSLIMQSEKIKKQIKPIYGFLNKQIYYWDTEFQNQFFKNHFTARTYLLNNNTGKIVDIMLQPYTEAYSHLTIKVL
ncbi:MULTISPECIES: antiviral reverse transcriptase Drt2 [unclassified Psychrobacter]|uniref:antiviral reverse transcriptase Drt2 n=1 Tax=unclassified Psychrobacter TaxID=196806 RepID=UPI003FCF731A